MKTLTMILSASALALSLQGCTALSAGVKKGDERNLARSINDMSAAKAIKARLHRADGFKLGSVNVAVAEGIVVLSGNVPRDEDRIEAERIAWSAPKVIQVGNEIEIRQGEGFVRSAKDTVLHESVKARLIATKSVKARNLNVEVHDGKVYLLGVARSPEELQQAATIAATTKGTREVISYIKLAGDQSQLTASGPGFNGVPSQSQSRSRAIVENPAPTSRSWSPSPSPAPAPEYSAQIPQYSAPAPTPARPQSFGPDVDLPPIADEGSANTPAPAPSAEAPIESGEPYYRDPVTGKRITLPPGVTPIPYNPERDGAIPGAPPPASASLGEAPGPAGSYIIDPKTGNMVKVFYPDNEPNVQIVH